MNRTPRPFDENPAAVCLTCGTLIAGGDFCLHCVPPSAREGESAWVRHRWFSGRAVELRRRRTAMQEKLRAATSVAAAGLVLFTGAWLAAPKLQTGWTAFESKPVHAQKVKALGHFEPAAVKMT